MKLTPDNVTIATSYVIHIIAEFTENKERQLPLKLATFCPLKQRQLHVHIFLKKDYLSSTLLCPTA